MMCVVITQCTSKMKVHVVLTSKIWYNNDEENE